MTEWNLSPLEIERRSFEIIDAEALNHNWTADEWKIVRRMVHTSADFDYVTSVKIHPGAIAAGLGAIKNGKPIITDTRMAQSGITGKRLKPFGVKVNCFVDHPDAAEKAINSGITRSAAAVEMALENFDIGIFVIGNAPTALFKLMQMIESGGKAPDLIVGLPVGFVNAAESKAALKDFHVPYITNAGRKGGSNVAAGAVNALAGIALERNNGN